MDEVDFTILAATSVFTDFMDKCPPAEACRDAFDRTVKATLKMVNASGGFGPHAAGASSSRNNLDHNRFNWNTRNDSAPMLNKPHHKRHFRNSASVDQTPNPLSDAYSNPSLLSAFQKGAQYRLPSGPAVKVEQDGYTHLRNLSVPPRINASPTDNATSPLTPDVTAANADQQMMPSPAAMQQRPTPPTAQQLSSPMAELVNQTPPAGFLSPRQRQQQQQQQQFSPGAMSFSELQGMEFLQNLSPAANNNNSNSNNDSGAGAAGGGGVGNTGGLDGVDFSGLADIQMDLGFGLGWEGLHHDFNDGQQLDLFDGFFFGGGPQQGGGGGGGGI